jgi:hypothetical protein
LGNRLPVLIKLYYLLGASFIKLLSYSWPESYYNYQQFSKAGLSEMPFWLMNIKIDLRIPKKVWILFGANRLYIPELTDVQKDGKLSDRKEWVL